MRNTIREAAPDWMFRLHRSVQGSAAGLVLLALLSACGDDAAGRTERAALLARDALQQATRQRAVALDPREHGIGGLLPDLAFTDIEGGEHRLSDFAKQRALVIAIREVGCPVAGRIGPATARLERELLARDVALVFVNLASHNTLEEMRGDVASFGFQGPYVADPEARLGRALGATSSTDFFLLDARRTLVYRGAADDQHGRGVSLAEPEQQFLLDALAALEAGQRPSVEATLAPGCILALEASEPAERTSGPTYHAEVSRIVQRNCVTCHRAGGAGPFALDTYAQLKGRRGMVLFMLKEKAMPPWLASHDSLPFLGDRRMSERELDVLYEWYDKQMPLGDPAEAPLPLEWHGEWRIGKPDHVFEDPEPFVVPAEGVVDLISTYMDVELPDDIWVDRIQVSASAPQSVHHSSVLLRFPEGHANDSQAGLRKGEDGYNWRFFMAYLPGAGSRVYPEGVGRLIPKGSVLRVVTHYTTNGLETPNRMRIGVIETKQDPKYVVETRMLRKHDIEIPPGAKDVRFEQEFRLPKDVMLFSVTPHMHLRGKRYLAWLQLADGARQKLIEIPMWDSNWQFSYVLREMLFLPGDSLIQYEVWYDNSVDNPANPDPSQHVTDGPQIWDEMMQMWVEWVRPRVLGE